MINKKRVFGTDGVRGKANSKFMNPLFLARLSYAICKVLNPNGEIGRSVVIAKDTRRSGYMVEYALTSSLLSMGINVILVGPIPTPFLPYLVTKKEALFGLMISASHNSFDYNGIKIFNEMGIKINDKIEDSIENIALDDKNFDLGNLDRNLANPVDMGRVSRIHNTAEEYSGFLYTKLRSRIKNLKGMNIVIDCAHGAAYKIAHLIFTKLGARITLINNKPDGFNINLNCGAVHPEGLAEIVVKLKADLGIGLDGDADRIVVCDELGNIVDNDQLFCIIAEDFMNLGSLPNNKVVSTIVSNVGLDIYLKARGIEVSRAQVGDKYIYEEMQRTGSMLGGEKSGHIIFSEFGSTGDGILSGLIISDILKRSKKKASKLFDVVKLFPQVIRNLHCEEPLPLETQAIQDTINSCKVLLGDQGRIVVRKSGTEPKIRVMAEGRDLEVVNKTIAILGEFLNTMIAQGSTT